MITLIATTHNESGLCNATELYKIIETIDPSVIFEEIPPSKFNAIYQGKLNDTLETTVVKQYLHKKTISHYAVDLDAPEMTDRGLRTRFQEMTAVFNNYCDDYRQFFDNHTFLSEYFGFPYLNSNQCNTIFERQHALEKEIIKSLSLGPLTTTYTQWCDLIERREHAMLKTIYNNCNQNKCTKALFLVGAAHRGALMQKIEKHYQPIHPELNWRFDYF